MSSQTAGPSVNACRRALAYIHDHDAVAIAAILPPSMGGRNRTAFLRLLKKDKRMFETDGGMPEGAARAEGQAMTALGPKYGTIAFGETFTNGFITRAR
ncbi:MAG: hypothetical protein ABIS14_07775 [Sphingomonas sp.]